MKNTAGWPRGGGVSAPKSDTGNTKKRVPPFDGLSEINYLCIAYVLTTNLGAKVQRKCPRKEIARIVGISQSTLSRELRRNFVVDDETSCRDGHMNEHNTIAFLLNAMDNHKVILRPMDDTRQWNVFYQSAEVKMPTKCFEA